MTLTDFLLARIAEDEGAVRELGDLYVRVGYDHPARVLAECEAKRRIVSFALTYRASRAFSQGVDPRTSGVATAMDLVLAFLALPYTDHPDYRGEWRP